MTIETRQANPRKPPSGVAVAELRHPRADDHVTTVEPARQPVGDYPAVGSVPVSVMVPVKNEQANIVECLRHLSWANHLTVIDSHSEDETIPLAQAMGAEVYQFTFSPEGWPKKKNWALANVPWPNQWVLIMDADEHVTPELAREIEAVVTGRYAHANGCGDGYWINRRFIFMGRWLKHCGYYPSWNIRLLKHAVGRYERIGTLGDTGSGDNEVHEHITLDTGEAGYLKEDFLHYAYPDLATWIEKHNRYSTWEAHVYKEGAISGQIKPRLFGGPIERKRWIKRYSRYIPMRPTARFIYAYIINLGFLDGYPGFVMSRLLAWYEFVSIAKFEEMKATQQPKPQRKTSPDKSTG